MKKILITLMTVTLPVTILQAEPPAGATAMTKDITKTWADSRGNDSQKWPLPVPLLAPDLSNAEFKAGLWQYADGVLSVTGSGGGMSELWTKESYANYALSLEFRCAEGTNSGVLLRCSDTADWINNTIEVQILQGEAPDGKQANGAIFDCLAPRRQAVIKPGEWHRYIIIANGRDIQVWLDNDEIIKMNLDDWPEAGKNPDDTPNKFKKAYKDLPREGRIGFQYHGTPVEFRNIRIEKF
ncbi:MAG: DUF1080 domain-containing protein [Verrucomicrobiales bacterium]|jgi:hypothetical protein|nr:DUF1080 domain-containing protein [Verrucomicrobiales bacterium]